MTSKSDSEKGGCIGLLIGVFVFPVLWMIALYSIPVKDALGKEVDNPPTFFAMMFMIPLAVIGAIVFGPLGAIIGYVIHRVREARKP
jgi:hypothetical protein